MSKSKKTWERAIRRRNRAKKTARFHPERPRLCVFRSNKNIEAQIIDDTQDKTLVSASSFDAAIRKEMGSEATKSEMSQAVGRFLAEKAKEKKITNVVFDRNGYPYHGRVKILADAAREGGLKF